MASYQNLTSLDMSTMPKSLKHLDVSFNRISGPLPNIDIDLTGLFVQGNYLTDLGRLPESLQNANFSLNPLTNTGELCNRKLVTCELKKTKLNATTCGTCLFS